MFGNNTKRGIKDYTLEDNQLLVTSIFHTLQGEAPFTGTPAYFVRLTGCNLACKFSLTDPLSACDAWFETGDTLTFEQIYDRMIASTKPNYAQPKLVVLTGGEPLLQVNSTAFAKWLMVEKGFLVQYETNGTVSPDKWRVPMTWETWEADIEARTEYKYTHKPYVVCSPKVPNLATARYHQPKPEMHDLVDAYKFVVTSEPDSPYHKLPDWLTAEFIGDRKVYISPINVYLKEPTKVKIEESNIENRSVVDETISFWTKGLLNHDMIQKNHEYAAQMCIEKGFSLSLQTHLFASLP